MTYLVNVCDHPDWLKAIQKFSNTVWFDSSKDGDINEALRTWHCKNIRNSPYIEFRSEKDAMIFLLKWS